MHQQAQRPAPAVAEVQRQSQLAPLLPLLPDDPQQLLSQYKQVAMTFRLYAVSETVQVTGMADSSVCGVV